MAEVRIYLEYGDRLAQRGWTIGLPRGDNALHECPGGAAEAESLERLVERIAEDRNVGADGETAGGPQRECMVISRRAARMLGCDFRLIINGVPLL